MAGVCEVLGLVSCFCYGVVLSTEGIVPNFDEGGGPRICEGEGLELCGVWLLSLEAIK